MSSPFCTIYLVRHGETEWNVLDRMQGHTNSPLTRKGKIDTKNLAKALKHIKFNAVYSSDLGRAQETAEIIALEHQLTVVTNKLVRERYFGRLEGRLWSELKLEIRDLLEAREQLADQARFRYKLFPEIESDEEIVTRIITFLREVSLVHLGQNVLVVSHGGIMRTLLIHLGYATYQELKAGSLANSGYIKLRCDGTNFFVDKTVGITKKPTN